MSNLIERVIVGEVSLVDEAANRREILLLKNLGEKPVEKLVKLALDTQLEDEGAIIEKLDGVSEESRDAVLASLRILQAHGEELNSDIMKSLATDFGLPEPVVEKKTEKKVEPPTEEPKVEDLPEDLREYFTKQMEANDTLQERLDKAELRADALERAGRLDEFIRKAKDLGLPGTDSEEFGETLLSIDESTPETYAKLVGVLEDTAKVLKESKLFKAVGSDADGGDTGDAWSRIQKAARQRMADTNGEISFQKAVDQIISEDKDLAKQYLKETR
jgi:hypothetical protein